jgi:hypothetical protein
MILWFAGMSVLIVWIVFQSPALDFRFVILGALIPTIEALLGAPYVLHTLVGAVLLLVVVVVATRHRRLVRRRWLGIPIGMMLHLVLDATWSRAELFWWPFLGDALGEGTVPELDRAWPVILLLEVVGAAVLAWEWSRFGLGDPERRQRFLRTGRLEDPC